MIGTQNDVQCIRWYSPDHDITYIAYNDIACLGSELSRLIYRKIGVSTFAALVATALAVASPLEFAKAQVTAQTPEKLNEQCVQEGFRFSGGVGECVLEARDPVLTELEADEAAADLDSGSNPVIDKLSSMNSTEAMKLLLELQVVENLKDLRAINMELGNQTVGLSATLNLTGDGWSHSSYGK